MRPERWALSADNYDPGVVDTMPHPRSSVGEDEPCQAGPGELYDGRRERMGNNRYHVPRSKKKARAKIAAASRRRNRR